jgi:hypothetical protein
MSDQSVRSAVRRYPLRSTGASLQLISVRSSNAPARYRTHRGSPGFIGGFIVMMVLDVGLG